ncbi:DUF4261 domain-containing protein [Novipirellula artificiosorum]|uniref:DUF4261 domain-containing protein n=1 Tax=Novipirellula artificiosorum TaxID=2528016 RepID=A0A5C6DZI6_9BACT|nr:DUF4261 domain-containing protein [Novipirellula artificiosorum]TWU42853.1 hypothetical protein Poly41_11540 [Novipirellula artificiosorum]
MAKGLFTQGMCVLLREPVSIGELEERLAAFELVGRHESIEDDDAPETLVLKYREDVGGHLLVTPCRSPWPDDMGDPDESPERFVAWSLGQFGPLAFPGCLQRASEQSWGWEGGADVVPLHTAHIRLLISYVLGMEEVDGEDDDEDIPLVPDEYDAMGEMQFITRAVTALLELPQAICYFNPGGEVLRDQTGLRQGLNYAWNHELPALDMWTNVRIFKADEEWSLMDTVGNGQLDLPDMEAIYRADQFEPADVERFLRNASLYMLTSEEEVEEGDTADGPGEISWLAMECAEALSDPPRPTIRWAPQNGTDPPAELLVRGDAPEEMDEDDFDEDFLDEDDDVDF